MSPALNSNCATPSSLQTRVVRSTRPLLKPMSLGEYSLEAHLNFVTEGDAPWDGTPLPTQYQTHLSMEPTVGLSETFAIGFMFLSAWEPMAKVSDNPTVG